MYREQKQYGQDPMEIRRTKPATFEKPILWNEKDPGLVFTSSWTDFFLEEADPWRMSAWHIIRMTPNNTYQILTKRPENIVERLPHDWGDGWPNVWLGVSVENQEMANLRIPILVDIPAKVRFLSCEPLIGPITLSRWLEPQQRIRWVIVGGESGPADRARPMHPFWAEQIQYDCEVAGVPFFFKQWGRWGVNPITKPDGRSRLLWPDGEFLGVDETVDQPSNEVVAFWMAPDGKKKTGCFLAGKYWFEMPGHYENSL
jgi:protein gp37